MRKAGPENLEQLLSDGVRVLFSFVSSIPHNSESLSRTRSSFNSVSTDDLRDLFTLRTDTLSDTLDSLNLDPNVPLEATQVPLLCLATPAPDLLAVRCLLRALCEPTTAVLFNDSVSSLTASYLS